MQHFFYVEKFQSVLFQESLNSLLKETDLEANITVRMKFYTKIYAFTKNNQRFLLVEFHRGKFHRGRALEKVKVYLKFLSNYYCPF